MKPTLADPFVWVDGHKYDFSDPAFIRARCRCGEVADFRVLFMGERGPHYRLDCPACGYRAPAIGPGDVFALALENVAGFVRDGETVWIEWKKIRSKPGTGVGGRYAPRDIVPPKAPPRKTCRSCADGTRDDGGWWCNELGQYVDPTLPCDGHRPKARGCAA